MKRLHQDNYRRATFMWHVCNEEQILDQEIRNLEQITPQTEQSKSRLLSLRKQRAELIACNIGRY